MSDRDLSIIIVGHVDHGKSTLIGRLLHDTGSLPPGKIDEIKAISESLGKELEFAFLMDHLAEERNRGITIEIAHTYFKTSKRRYVIIDSPGHKEFLKNMITGATQAEAAVLLVDAKEGVQDQTMRHCHLLSLLGLNQVIVLVNKMDAVSYSPKDFLNLEKNITLFMKKCGLPPVCILPVSAKTGENIAKKTNNLAWFNGPAFLEALDALKTVQLGEKDLRFPIQDIYEIDGEFIAVGRVESGLLKKGQDVTVAPTGEKCTIKEIKKFQQENILEACSGDCIGVQVEGEKLKRGQILETNEMSTVSNSINASLFWMNDNDYTCGTPITWKCATQEVDGKISKIHKRFDPASIELIEENSSKIHPADIAEVEIILEKTVAYDRFSEFPEMGRFVLEQAGCPVAGGIIT